MMKMMTLCYVVVVSIFLLSKYTYAANVPTEDDEQIPSDRGQLLQTICKSLCSSPLQCPRACVRSYVELLPGFDKRAPGFLDGFTFDDYLFMRLLGRDMHGRRK